MTDATSVTRTYAVGDQLDDRDMPIGDTCRADIGSSGYVCSLPPGHTGPQHVGAYSSGHVVAVVDRDTSGDPIVEIPTREALQERLDTAVAELARLRALAERAERALGAAEEQHEEFRRTVVRVAQEKARQHGWCRVVNAALNDMGLDANSRFRVPVTVTATRTIHVQVDAEDAESAWQAVDHMSESELADAYEADTGDDFSYNVLGSGDWEWQSHDSSTNVTNLDD
jgi:hypothetical protein